MIKRKFKGQVGIGQDGKKYYLDEELVFVGCDANGPVRIQGVDVNKFKWKDLNQIVTVQLPGEGHLHDCFMYEIKVKSRVIRFAASEISQSNYVYFIYKKV